MLGKIKSMVASLGRSLRYSTPIKGCVVKMTGDTLNPPTIDSQYNVTSVTRFGIGVYRVTLQQSTMYGTEIYPNGVVTISHNIAPIAATDYFTVSSVYISPTIFEIKSYEVRQGASPALSLVAYDLTPSDTVDLSILLNYGDGRLPPA